MAFGGSVRRLFAMVAPAVLLLLPGGCFLGDPAATRTIEIKQFQSTQSYSGPFEIDTDQLPLGSVRLTQEKDHWGSPVTKVTIDMHHSVRIVLIPATQPQ
jgi:hypothetical protein